MPTILLAPDSLKGSLSALAACNALEAGVRRAFGNDPTLCIDSVPLADGGEGTVAAFLRSRSGTSRSEAVLDSRMCTVDAEWAALDDGIAVIELAAASGLTLVPQQLRDAGLATTVGTGQLLKAALQSGCRDLLIGIGGSATTDGGAGALSVLGARFLDAHGQELPWGGAALGRLHSVDLSKLVPALAEARIRVLCDVSNPLCGSNGAAVVYGPQKGATPHEVVMLDSALGHFADVVAREFGFDYRDVPGAGAAGGTGFGLMSFAGATLVPGIETVLEATDFASRLENADLVLTAEGCIDSQTLNGKALAGVAKAAGRARGGKGVPVIAFAGAVKLSPAELRLHGFALAVPISNAALPLQESQRRAAELLADSAETAIRAWRSGAVAGNESGHYTGEAV